MAEFVYFRNACSMYYPVGQYFSEENFDYIREAASSINKVFPTGKLILIGEWKGKKQFFNVLLDDRAGLESAYNNLKYVLDNANTESD